MMLQMRDMLNQCQEFRGQPHCSTDLTSAALLQQNVLLARQNTLLERIAASLEVVEEERQLPMSMRAPVQTDTAGPVQTDAIPRFGTPAQHGGKRR